MSIQINYNNNNSKKNLTNLVLFVEENYNINGSVHNIAGIINKMGNVLGMMPHPERAIDAKLGGNDGINFFKNFFEKLG